MKTIATTKLSVKPLKGKFFSQILVLMCLKHIYKSFSVNIGSLKNYFLLHFGHYLVRACCNIHLVLVWWVTYMWHRGSKPITCWLLNV